uniref:Cytochrome c oxidase subunit NDUFA4 n=1 Tax=Castor canadensis TaxID=51338 RepID=A0A8C0WYK3_CASCN
MCWIHGNSRIYRQCREAFPEGTEIPLFVFIGAGGTGAAQYMMRLALFNPDVSWDRKNNPEPWNKVGPNDQYKFYSVNVDYSKLKKEGPDF